MVVVSHLFFFLWKKLGRGAAHMSRPSPYLELSISRQPLFVFFCLHIHPPSCQNKELSLWNRLTILFAATINTKPHMD